MSDNRLQAGSAVLEARPFMVTVRRDTGQVNAWMAQIHETSLHACATQDEMHETAREACLLAGGSVNAIAQCVREVFTLGDDGGEVQLPDGSKVTVEPASYLAFWLALSAEEKAGLDHHDERDWPVIVAAFNSRERS